MRFNVLLLFVSLAAIISAVNGAPLFGIFNQSQNWFQQLQQLIPGFSVSTDHWKAGPIVQVILQKIAQVEGQIFQKVAPFQANQAFASWKTFKANGVNLGGWMELENSITPEIFEANGNPPDEWTLCGNLGDKCGPLMERHYATYFTKQNIDLYAQYGINTLRVPTTYQAWINVPGSQLYHGNQQKYLRDVLDYAVGRYGMKIVLGLHSLPGGINSLDIGEALFHKGWFNNATNLDYSFQAVTNVLKFISASPFAKAYAISPLNEASDDLSKFGSPGGLSDAGVDWINTYLRGTLKLINQYAPGTTMFVQDCFKGPAFFQPFYPANSNIVIDTHIYFFAAAGAYANYMAESVCGQASYYASLNNTFPIFVGEWSLQSQFNNTLASRKVNYQTQVYAYSKYLSGGTSWNAKHNSSQPVSGEGIQSDYWSLEKLITAGAVNPGGKLDAVYCKD